MNFGFFSFSIRIFYCFSIRVPQLENRDNLQSSIGKVCYQSITFPAAPGQNERSLIKKSSHLHPRKSDPCDPSYPDLHCMGQIRPVLKQDGSWPYSHTGHGASRYDPWPSSPRTGRLKQTCGSSQGRTSHWTKGAGRAWISDMLDWITAKTRNYKVRE